MTPRTCLTALSLSLATSVFAEFGAYYTKIDSGNDNFPRPHSHFTGAIRNVAVYDYALTDALVETLCEETGD